MSTLTALNPQVPQRPLTGKRGLLAWGAALAMIWLVVLPWLAERPRLKADMQYLQDRGVDPSAMYYTELEAIKPVLRRIYARQRGQNPGPLDFQTAVATEAAR